MLLSVCLSRGEESVCVCLELEGVFFFLFKREVSFLFRRKEGRKNDGRPEDHEKDEI